MKWLHNSPEVPEDCWGNQVISRFLSGTIDQSEDVEHLLAHGGVWLEWHVVEFGAESLYGPVRRDIEEVCLHLSIPFRGNLDAHSEFVVRAWWFLGVRFSDEPAFLHADGIALELDAHLSGIPDVPGLKLKESSTAQTEGNEGWQSPLVFGGLVPASTCQLHTSE
jgi:hypothetical protein